MDLSGLPDDTLDPGLDLGGLPDTNAKALREQYRATTGTPDDAAKVIDITKRTGLPKPVVERNRQEAERKALEPDWGDLETSAPITVREMAANVKLFELANDDTENLRNFERTLNRRSEGRIGGPAFDRTRGEVKPIIAPAAGFSSVVAGQLGVLPNTFERIRQGLRLEIADLFNLGTVRDDALRQRERTDFRESISTPYFDSTLGRWVYGGAANVQRVVPSIAAGIATRSPAVGLAAMGAQVQPEIYGKYRGRGGTPGEAALGSGVETAIEIGTEMLPMGFVVEKFGKAGATQFLAGYLGRELPTELAAEVAQGAVDTAIANPNKTWGEYVAELPDTVGQTVTSTLMMSGGLTAANEAARRLAGPQAQADTATQDAEALAQLSQLAAASKLRARDPQTFQEFVAAANEDGPVQDIYLDARTLQQAGIDPALLAQASPAVAAQIEQALATGGDLVIPMAEYAARIAGTDLDPVLTPHLRTSEEGLSLDEAQRFYQGQAEEFQKVAAQVMEEKTADDAWTASAKAVEVKLFDELKGAGRFTDDVNTAYATLMRDFYVATASRLGVTPEEMFARYPLRVAAERMAGEGSRMSQEDVNAAERAGFDSSQVWLHGTTAARDFKSFKLGDGELGPGVYLTKTPMYANAWARGENARIMQLFIKKGDVFDLTRLKIDPNQRIAGDQQRVDTAYSEIANRVLAAGALPTTLQGMNAEDLTQRIKETSKQREALNKWLDMAGYVGAKDHTSQIRDQVVIFRPESIRSISAKFNPKKADSKNILAQAAQSVMQALGIQTQQAEPVEQVDTGGPALDMGQFFQSVEEYGGEHRPPGPDNGAPLYDLTGGGNIYPDDVYSMNAARYYGHGEPALDNQTVAIVHSLKGRPNASVKIYRAIPDVLSNEEKLAKIELQMKKYLARNTVPEGENPDGWYDRAGAERDRLRSLPPEPKGEKVAINPGDWVTVNRAYAKEHGESALNGNYKIISKTVKAKEVFTNGDSIHEYGYWPEGSYSQGNRGEIAFGRDITQTPSVITLFANADLSTALHEMGHFQLEVLAHIAGQPNAPAEIAADMARVLEWFGIRGDETVAGGETAGSLGQGNKYLDALRAGEVPVPEGGFNAEDKRGFGDLWRRGFAVIEERDGGQFLRLGRGNWYEEATPEQQKVLDSLEDTGGAFRDLEFRGGTDDVYEAAEAAFTDSEVAPKVREVPFATLGELLPGYDTPAEAARIDALAKAIKENGEIAPIFVGIDPTGETFIMEGQHRARALQLLGYDAVPARVVVDMSDTGGVLNQGDDQAKPSPLGPKKTGRTALEVWQAMSLEEKRPYHEMFARGFEAYLFEGKAPSQELTGLFARFRSWLISVYKSVKALNVDISDDIRQVFDRLIATDEAIKQAEAMRSYAPLFKSAEEMGDAEMWAEYQRTGAEATQNAVDGLQRRSLRDMQWLTNARGRILKQLQADAKAKRKAVEDEVRAEVKATPVYAAMHFLKRGEMVAPDGEQVKVEKGYRLDTAALAEMYPETMLARPALERLQGMTRKDGLAPDLVAEMFGFSSGDQLVREIIAAQPEAEVVEGMTDQRVLERYGDLANPDTLARAVDEAIHNEARARFVATELKALSKAMTPVRAIAKAAKDFAAATIARKKVRDIKPRQHAAAESRAAKAAEKAMAAGDTATAAVEKRNQLVQNYSTRLSYEALDEIGKAVKYLRKFDSEGTRKNLDTEYVDQIDQLLERFDLRASVTNKAADKRAKLAAWLEAQREQGFEPDIPADLVDSAMRKPYRELTLEELRGLVDTVKQIEHLGRLKQKLLTAKDEREFKAIRDEIAASIEANAKGTRELRTRTTTGAMLTEAGNRFLAMHRKMASVAREMDGYADGGPVWEYFIRSMNEAGDRETTRRADATARLYALVKPLTTSGKMGGKGVYFDTLGMSLNREERIAIALNLGNAGNMQRLLDGQGWTMTRLQPVLDTITPEEADFVQAVWDFFESYRPEIRAKERRIYGKEPDWVEPVPITLGGKTLKGGYYPIKYDPAASGRAEQHAEADAAKAQMRGAYTTATTRRSFTKSRAEEVTGRPLLYSLAGLYQGANEVIHDLSWHEWLIDVNRLLRSLDGPIRTHYGPETVGVFKKAIEDIAAGDVPAQNVFERGINHVRTGATIAGLGWNLMTSLLQPVGLTQSAVRIGPGWVAKGMSQWIKAPLDTLTEINGKSPMMASRAQTMQREINEIQNQVRGSHLDPVRATFFVLIQKMQMIADVPTWLGAYEKAVAEGQAEDRAVALADQAVLDAQGGGQMKDLSQIQRGHPALKLFTNFYSFFNVAYNLGVEKTKQKITQPKLYPSLALDYLLLYVLPAAFVTVMKDAILGGDDDEDKLVQKIIADQISYLLGLMVGLREVTAAVQKVAGVEQFKGSYGGPAGLRLFQEIDKLGQQIGQGEADMALFKAANNAAGILFHYPSGQVNRSVEGVAALVEGKTQNPMAVVVGPPKP